MIASATTKPTSATYCSGFDCTVCATCVASQPTTMKAPRISSQLKPSIDCAIGTASPLSNRYVSMPANSKIAAATWP